MRYYIPNAEFASNVSADAFAKAYEKRACPLPIDAYVCLDTGALLIDFVDGSTVEIGNGEAVTVRYNTGKRDAHGDFIYSLSTMLLHLESNARTWFAYLAHERNLRLIEQAERSRAIERERSAA